MPQTTMTDTVADSSHTLTIEKKYYQKNHTKNHSIDISGWPKAIPSLPSCKRIYSYRILGPWATSSNIDKLQWTDGEPDENLKKLKARLLELKYQEIHCRQFLNRAGIPHCLKYYLPGYTESFDTECDNMEKFLGPWDQDLDHNPYWS